MSDSPPNPEDGELWIPSDVFYEIISSTVSPKKDSHSASNEKFASLANPRVVRHPKKLYTRSSLPKETSNSNSRAHSSQSHLYVGDTQMQPYDYGFPRSIVQSNEIGFISNGIPNVYHPNVPSQQFTGPMHMYNPIFQPITQSEAAMVQGTMGNLISKHRGTGVFLPSFTTIQKSNHTQESSIEKEGIEVFSNHHPEITTHHKKKKSGKNAQWNQKSSSTKKNTVEQK